MSCLSKQKTSSAYGIHTDKNHQDDHHDIIMCIVSRIKSSPPHPSHIINLMMVSSGGDEEEEKTAYPLIFVILNEHQQLKNELMVSHANLSLYIMDVS